MKIKRAVLPMEKIRDFFESETFKTKKEIVQRKYALAALWYLDQGKVRVMENGQLNTWVKRAILTYFKHSGSSAMSAGIFQYYDKLPVKSRNALKRVRVVPGAVVRFGSFVDEGAILMPSFINIGAYVGKSTMVDTWATVGSCAQIGSHVHLSGGVGIGGVLEPEQASPVIIEDGAFIGSRCVVVEGVRVGKEAVLGAGVVLTASTTIIDVTGEKPVHTKGFIPERAVVIPGTTKKTFPAGEFEVPCALIIGTRKASTDLKTSLNDALRAHNVAV